MKLNQGKNEIHFKFLDKLSPFNFIYNKRNNGAG